MSRYAPHTLLRLWTSLVSRRLSGRFFARNRRDDSVDCDEAMDTVHALVRGEGHVDAAKVAALGKHVMSCNRCWERFERERVGRFG